jgi:hypothetical protein
MRRSQHEPMIRNVVVGRLGPDDGPGQAEEAVRRLEEGLAGIAALDLPGQLAVHVGRDIGIREGGWSFAITSDWVDVDAYRVYDVDAEHDRYRSMIVGACAEIARVQFVIED